MAGTQYTRNASIAVRTSATLVSPELLEGQRYALVLTNTSTGGQIISVSWGDEPANGKGIVLYPAGGTHSESIDSSFIPNNQMVRAISDGVNGTLALHERIVK